MTSRSPPAGPGNPGPLDWLLAQPFSHRGLHDSVFPENSLAAMEAATAVGMGVEIDVHLAADGVPVVVHDYDLKRVAGVEDRVAELGSGDLAGVRLLGTDHGVPTLAKALQVIGAAPTLVEIKDPPKGVPLEALAGAVAECLEGDPHLDRRAVMSFAPAILAWFARHRPDLPRGQVSSDFRHISVRLPLTHKLLLRHLLVNYLSKPHFIAYDIRSLPAVMPALFRSWGKPLLAWTVKSEEALARARRHADNIIWKTLPVDRVHAWKEREEWRPAAVPAPMADAACD